MASRKVVVVIGASAPCGQTICEALSKEHTVYAQYNSTEPSIVNDNIHWTRGQLDTLKDCESFINFVLADTKGNPTGRLDVLINVIGPITHTHINNLSFDEWNSQVHLNLNVVFYMCKLAQSHVEKNRGHIINFSYAGAEQIKTQLDTLPYSIAKTGVVILSKTLAAAMAPSGARCNVIAPGFIDSHIVLDATRERAKNMVPMGRMASTAEIADSVMWLLNSPHYITGATTNVSGGLEF